MVEPKLLNILVISHSGKEVRGLGGRKEGRGRRANASLPSCTHWMCFPGSMFSLQAASSSILVHKVWGLLSLQDRKMMEPKYTSTTLL